MSQFKIGHKVQCIDPGSHMLLNKNRIYTISNIDLDFDPPRLIFSETGKTAFLSRRFLLITPGFESEEAKKLLTLGYRQ